MHGFLTRPASHPHGLPVRRWFELDAEAAVLSIYPEDCAHADARGARGGRADGGRHLSLRECEVALAAAEGGGLVVRARRGHRARAVHLHADTLADEAAWLAALATASSAAAALWPRAATAASDRPLWQGASASEPLLPPLRAQPSTASLALARLLPPALPAGGGGLGSAAALPATLRASACAKRFETAALTVPLPGEAEGGVCASRALADAGAPSPRRAALLIAAGCAHVLASAAVVFGWAALEPVLLRTGAFARACDGADGGGGAGANREAGGLHVCAARAMRLQLMFSVGCLGSNVGSVVFGAWLDSRGARETSALGASALCAGALLLARGMGGGLGAERCLLAGYGLVGLGGPAVQLAATPLAALAGPRRSSLALAALVACANGSEAVWPALAALERAGVPASSIFVLYAAIALAILASGRFIWPESDDGDGDDGDGGGGGGGVGDVDDDVDAKLDADPSEPKALGLGDSGRAARRTTRERSSRGGPGDALAIAPTAAAALEPRARAPRSLAIPVPLLSLAQQAVAIAAEQAAGGSCGGGARASASASPSSPASSWFQFWAAAGGGGGGGDSGSDNGAVGAACADGFGRRRGTGSTELGDVVAAADGAAASGGGASSAAGNDDDIAKASQPTPPPSPRAAFASRPRATTCAQLSAALPGGSDDEAVGEAIVIQMLSAVPGQQGGEAIVIQMLSAVPGQQGGGRRASGAWASPTGPAGGCRRLPSHTRRWSSENWGVGGALAAHASAQPYGRRRGAPGLPSWDELPEWAKALTAGGANARRDVDEASTAAVAPLTPASLSARPAPPPARAAADCGRAAPGDAAAAAGARSPSTSSSTSSALASRDARPPSFRSQLCSRPFARLVCLVSLHSLRLSLAIGTMGPLLAAKMPSAPLRVDALAAAFAAALPLGVLAAPLSGWLLSGQRPLAFAFVACDLVGLGYALLLAQATSETALRWAFGLVSLSQQLLYATYFAALAIQFGFVHYGKLAAVANGVVATVGTAQYPLGELALRCGYDRMHGWLGVAVLPLLAYSVLELVEACRPGQCAQRGYDTF